MLMIAPTGARRQKSDHPALPITTGEIVATAVASRALGAGALHLHVRDQDGRHSLDPGRYAETLAAVKDAAPNMRVQVSTESGGSYAVIDQLHLLQTLKPNWASVSVREIARDPEIAPRLYRLCADQGTEIQHILYDDADAELLKRWIDEGLIASRPSVILVLGRYDSTQKSDPDALPARLAALPETSAWMVCAFGREEHATLKRAHELGGDLRVGFENSITDADGALWPDMPASLAALHRALTPTLERT